MLYHVSIILDAPTDTDDDVLTATVEIEETVKALAVARGWTVASCTVLDSPDSGYFGPLTAL